MIVVINASQVTLQSRVTAVPRARSQTPKPLKRILYLSHDLARSVVVFKSKSSSSSSSNLLAQHRHHRRHVRRVHFRVRHRRAVAVRRSELFRPVRGVPLGGFLPRVSRRAHGERHRCANRHRHGDRRVWMCECSVTQCAHHPSSSSSSSSSSSPRPAIHPSAARGTRNHRTFDDIDHGAAIYAHTYARASDPYHQRSSRFIHFIPDAPSSIDRAIDP